MAVSRLSAVPMSLPLRLFLALLILVGISACGSDDDGFRERAAARPSGIVETDADGNVVNWPQSETDWETSPSYLGIIIFDALYPNPSGVASTLRIPVTVRTAGVRGGLYIEWIRDGMLVRIAEFPYVLEPGFYVLDFDAALFGTTGLFRIFITDGRGDVVSYGDIRIE